jgi:hypothetical protein
VGGLAAVQPVVGVEAAYRSAAVLGWVYQWAETAREYRSAAAGAAV